VCPFNIKFAQELKVPEFAPRAVISGRGASSLARELLATSQSEFSAAFKGSPMKRAKLRGLRRNAAIVLGNVAEPSAVPALSDALSDDETLVREHAAWALGRIGSPEARDSLLARAAVEDDSRVVAARLCSRGGLLVERWTVRIKDGSSVSRRR
jgi:epoxyqueuosine reductase